MTTLYRYNPTTGEYAGSQVAQKRPNGQAILDVLNTTTVAPPEVPEGDTAAWSVADGTWSLVEDHRQHYDTTGVKTGGTPYWLEGDTYETVARYMTELGPLPEGALLEAPAEPEPTTEDLAEQVRAERDARITACDWVITRHRDEIDEGEGTTLTSDGYVAWLAYRKALRDLPNVEGFPWSGGGADDAECPWPVEPTGNTETE